MDSKPAQQPEVIMPSSTPPPPKNDNTSMPPLKETSTSIPKGTIANPTNTQTPTNSTSTPNNSNSSSPSSPFAKMAALPKNIKIAFAIIAGIFMLLIISLVGFSSLKGSKPQPTPTPPFVNQPTPTPDPTSNWRVYSNEKYGFGIKYPHEFTISNQLEDQRFEFSEGIDIKNFNRVTRFTNPNATWIQIESLYTKEEITNLLEWVKNEFPTINRNGTASGALRNIIPSTAASQEIVVFEDGINETRKNVVFYKDRRMIVITLFPIAENGGSYTDIKESGNYLNQMLATFRFTDITYIPIDQNVLFDLPSGWKVLEETRDRIYLSTTNELKIIKIFKKTNISNDDLDFEMKKKMISDIKNEYGIQIQGNFSNQISGCQKTAGCNRLYSLSIRKGTDAYIIQYENNNKDEIFAEILKTITIK